MKILCTICARGGSKGLRNKNIKNINGSPLIHHTINQAINSKLFDKIVVSSDSDKILNISNKKKIDYLIKRSKKLSSSSTPKIPVIRNALIEAEKKFNIKFDYIMDLDVSSPLRNLSDIKKSMKKIIREKKEILFSVCESKKNPYFNMVEKKNGSAILVKKMGSFFTRQSSPKVFDMNASLYIWKRETLLTQNTLFIKDNTFFTMPYERSIDIDSLTDFKLVKYFMK